MSTRGKLLLKHGIRVVLVVLFTELIVEKELVLHDDEAHGDAEGSPGLNFLPLLLTARETLFKGKICDLSNRWVDDAFRGVLDDRNCILLLRSLIASSHRAQGPGISV